MRPTSRYLVAKRLFDLLFSLAGLLLFSPLFLLIALWVRLDSRGPVIFTQQRVGKEGKLFRIYKFRTMVPDAERQGTAITVANDRRVTACGAFLRKYKLDELPQLVNILKGEMTLIGPRPEVPHYVRLYTKEQRQVLLMTPGLTDEASIKYRNENELLREADCAERVYVEQIMPDKLRINLEYMRSASLRRDLQIIWKTVGEVLRK